MSASWYLYLIRTGDGILYTGITTDLARRLGQHERGVGAKALRGKGPLTLVFHCPAGDRSNALQWEYRIKQLTHRQKEQLVAGQASTLEGMWSKVFSRRA
ncbi:GIY-YIG nuclease family protein [Sodalis sp. dw_96]|uniref:GIY-YIG nuclease family protein n=1 Tax=Sodalis sp. dw_96 TaxID=2719794 RepID=UPI001BD27D2C|nr:GIY-YIG nuclease family protein [Sodalis sp. dw_96]